MMRVLRILLAGAGWMILPAGASMAAVTGMTGGGEPHTNIQPELGINFLVRTDATSPFLGEIRLFAGTFAPAGFRFADGQVLPVSANPTLANQLGNTYGGDGVNTFALPDLRGEAAIGARQGAGLTNRPLGQPVGANNLALSVAQLPAHRHDVVSLGVQTDPIGGGQPRPNMQASLPVNYTIATVGIFTANGGTGGTRNQPHYGEVRLTASPAAPAANFSFTDGQEIPISPNTALFSAIGGFRFGGNGTTTFALPDTRGRAVFGPGTGAGLTARTVAQRTGAESATVTEAQLPPHTHTLPPTALMTGSTGGGQPIPNVQPSLGLNYLIATEGLFPPRLEPGFADSFNDGDGRMTGEIILTATDQVPAGFARCEGQLLSISSNTALFSLLGDAYGGDLTAGTFALPDLRGRIPVHVGADPALAGLALGQSAGMENVTLTVNQLPAHDHTYVPEPTAACFTTIALWGLSLQRQRRGRE